LVTVSDRSGELFEKYSPDALATAITICVCIEGFAVPCGA
jgi:hypothetical protein